MTLHLYRLLVALLFAGVPLSLRAEIILYAFQSTAPAAVEALNARSDHEKYVLSDKPLSSKFTVPRSRQPLNVSKIPKEAPVLRTSVAMVVDKTGTVVDAAAFNFNDQAFADVIVKAIPKMVVWVPNNTKKHERALIIFTLNTRSPDPEEFVSGPAS